MQAYAEGFDIMRGASSKELREDLRYDLNIADIAEVWRRGSVVGSWLLDLTAMALVEDPSLKQFTGFVHDSGEGRWTIMAAIEEAVPADVLSASLFTRFRSRQEHTFAEKINRTQGLGSKDWSVPTVRGLGISAACVASGIRTSHWASRVKFSTSPMDGRSLTRRWAARRDRRICFAWPR